MSTQVTIVMYHFVRDLKHSRYPGIKGLTVDEFKHQLSYFKQHYNFINMQDCIDAVYSDKALPKNPVLLTFDDAYIDHFLTVFPLLDEYNVQGCFFPPAKAIQENEVLDVNKIHFILAAAPNTQAIVEDLKVLFDELIAGYKVQSFEHYYDKLAKPSRFDDKDVIFIKRLLQSALPLEARRKITDKLFRQYVTEDEASFSKELYMNKDQLRCMVRNGMYVGGHGYDHFWLDTLNQSQQGIEISKTIDFLNSINPSINEWVMCYPYGAYNNSLILILKNNQCKLALTTEVGIANVTGKDAYTVHTL